MSAAPVPILQVAHLSRTFPVRNTLGWASGTVRALDGVSFDVRPGETLGIVGESGCGKSTLGKALAGIHIPDGGRIAFEGQDVTALSVAERRRVAPRLQYCYQDPGNSLDPRQDSSNLLIGLGRRLQCSLEWMRAPLAGSR